MHRPIHQPPHYLSTKDRIKRWGLLGLFTAPLLGAVSHGQGYKLPWLSCPIRRITGCPCPTCGMTRSFTAFTQGHWQESVSMHFFGPILLFMFAIAALHIAMELITEKRYSTLYTQFISSKTFQCIGLGVYLGYYLLRLLLIGYPDNFANTLI